MKPAIAVTELHHVTGVATDLRRLLDFYGNILGLHLFRRTVDFDDPGVEQIYFSVAPDAPIVLSFLIRPKEPRGRKGPGQIGALTFAVPHQALPYWRNRLDTWGVEVSGAGWVFGEEHLCFTDPDGLELSLVELPAEPEPPPGTASAILGLRSVEIQLDGFEKAAQLLDEVFALTDARRDGSVFRFTAPGSTVVVDLLCVPNRRAGSAGAGVLQHLAWRVPTQRDLTLARKFLVERGLDVTPLLDRELFTAIYFKAPGGATWALAADSDAPPPSERGADLLHLPPWLEPRRTLIQRRLSGAS